MTAHTVARASTGAARQRRSKRQRIGRTCEVEWLIDHLVEAQRMLRRKRLAQHFLGQAHVGDLLDLRFAAIPAIGRQRQGSIEKRGNHAEERKRDKELEERESTCS